MSEPLPPAASPAPPADAPPVDAPPPPADAPADEGAALEASAAGALLAATFLIATSGLIYELVAGAMASYLLGDSVTQFSLVIGCYLSAMGLGSWLSRWAGGDLLGRFLQVEVAVAVFGGCSATALYLAHAYLDAARPVLFLFVGAVGTMVGLEIPLLMRVLKDQLAFAEVVARVLAFDYLGALAASLLFPLLLLPALGLARTAFLFGALNAAVAFLLGWRFQRRLGDRWPLLRAQALGALVLLSAGLALGEQVEAVAEQAIYEAPVLIRRRTPYQTISVTRWREDVRLYLDDHLQFSSRDEHRYHEALVHPAAAAVAGPLRSALVLGGGDGMALRELLRYPTLERATLVDLDREMLTLFREEELLRQLNHDAYRDPRVTVHAADAMLWLEESEEVFDLVVVDLPDPRNYAIGKLYTREFYRLVERHVSRSGALVVQATSPYAAPRAFWCIVQSVEAAGFTVYPYHAYVESFGDWGYALGLPQPRPRPARLAPEVSGLRFLDDATLASLFVFPRDQAPPPGLEINRLGEQVLVHYHEQDWRRSD